MIEQRKTISKEQVKPVMEPEFTEVAGKKLTIIKKSLFPLF